MKDFLVNNWELLISIIISVVSLVLTFIKARKAGNTKKQLELYSQIPNLVREAELMFIGEKQGLSRLNYVLTKLRVYALENNISIDTIKLEQQVENEVKTLNLSKPTETPSQDVNNDTSVVVKADTDNKQVNLNI